MWLSWIYAKALTWECWRDKLILLRNISDISEARCSRYCTLKEAACGTRMQDEALFSEMTTTRAASYPLRVTDYYKLTTRDWSSKIFQEKLDKYRRWNLLHNWLNMFPVIMLLDKNLKVEVEFLFGRVKMSFSLKLSSQVEVLEHIQEPFLSPDEWDIKSLS